MKCPPATSPPSTDYCDVCGVAMAAEPTAPPPRRPRRAPGACTHRVPALLGRQRCRRAVLRGVRLRLHHRVDAAPTARPTGAARPQARLASIASGDQPVAAARRVAGWPRSGSIPTGTPTRRAPTPCPRRGCRTVVVPAQHLDPDRPRLAQPQHHPGHRPVLRHRHQPSPRPAHHRRSRWWVEDLGSSNGTYVGGAVDALPKTPVAPGQKQEVGPDDRIYLGAWTRIVVRKAAPGEA